MGGERFVGHYIIATALARRHHVSMFHRYAPATASEPRGEHILGDRNKDLSRLFDGGWEAVVGITRYTATDVERLADAIFGAVWSVCSDLLHRLLCISADAGLSRKQVTG